MPTSFTRYDQLKWLSSTRYQYYRYQVGQKTSRGDKRKPLAYQGYWSLYSLKATGQGSPFLYLDAWNSQIPNLVRDPTYGTDRKYQVLCDKQVNKVRASFIEIARGAGKAQVGETIVQATDMLSIIEKRALQLARAMANLKKGRFGDFLADFGLPTPGTYEFRPSVRKRHHSRGKPSATPPGGWASWTEPSKRNAWEDRSRMLRTSKALKAKDYASIWLEYWFVWAPTVNDIAVAAEILSKGSPPHGQTITTRTSGFVAIDIARSYSSGELFKSRYGGTLRSKTRFSGQVSCLNPNGQLFDQLGISNIPLVLWWATPFSFLVDWVANVSELLESFQDTWDWLINNGQLTQYRYTTDGFDRYQSQYAGTANEAYSVVTHYVTRQVGVGLPEVRFVVAVPKLSLTRAATAISLLASHLKSV